MALDRIYQIIRGGTTIPLWAEHRADSALATVGESIAVGAAGTLVAPLSTVTIRMRWRDDIYVNTALKDNDARIWFVNEVLEVGRQQWLDVGMSTYDLAAPDDEREPDTEPPDDIRMPTNAPQTGWAFTTGGQPWTNLVVATVRVESTYILSGTFTVPTNIMGDIAAEQLSSDWYARHQTSDTAISFSLVDTTSPVDPSGFRRMFFHDEAGADMRVAGLLSSGDTIVMMTQAEREAYVLQAGH